jgi:hypothetical protein
MEIVFVVFRLLRSIVGVFLSATPIILLYIIGRRQLLSGLIAGFSK